MMAHTLFVARNGDRKVSYTYNNMYLNIVFIALTLFLRSWISLQMKKYWKLLSIQSNDMNDIWGYLWTLSHPRMLLAGQSARNGLKVTVEM